MPTSQTPNPQPEMGLFSDLAQIRTLEQSIMQQQQASLATGGGASGGGYNSQLLEQQVRMNQLQQLQQLQNQIFQQQMALISGSSPPIFDGATQEMPNFIDPLPNSLLSSPLTLQKQIQSIVHSPTSPVFHSPTSFTGPPSHPPSPDTHADAGPYNITAPHSAPEHVAFNIYGGDNRRQFYIPPTSLLHSNLRGVPEDHDISPIPSPYLGAPYQQQKNQHQNQTHPLKSTHRSSSSASSIIKRPSSPATTSTRTRKKSSVDPDDEEGRPQCREPESGKDSSSLIVNRHRKQPYRGSRSTNSTPFLGSTMPTALTSISPTPMPPLPSVSGSVPSSSARRHPSISVTHASSSSPSSSSSYPSHTMTTTSTAGTATQGSVSMPDSSQSMTAASGSFDTPSPVDLGEALGADSMPADQEKEREDGRLMPPPPVPPLPQHAGGNGNISGPSSRSPSIDPVSSSMTSNHNAMDVDVGAGDLNNTHMMEYMGMGMMEMNLGMGFNVDAPMMDGLGAGMAGFAPGPEHHQDQHSHSSHGMDDLMSRMGWGLHDFNRGQGENPHSPPPQPSSPPPIVAPVMPATPASIMNIGRPPTVQMTLPSSSSTPAVMDSSDQPSITSNASRGHVRIPSSKGSALGTPLTTIPTPSSAIQSPNPVMTRPKRAGSGAGRGANVASTTAAKDSASGKAPSAKRGGKSATAGTPSMKPILPAGTLPSTHASGSTSSAVAPLPILPSSSSGTPSHPHASSNNSPSLAGGGPTLAVRKTSHKAAEQKRRDSLKTTFDDLRRLLPPIALPSAIGEDPSVDAALISNPQSPFPFFLSPSAPLLPGAKPPRGPPKTGAGGDDLGPNKGVSKLQLLICGNEFIRMMKERVERRDEEVARLRREVGRLRRLLSEAGVEDLTQGELEVDLEKDVDACEKERFYAEMSMHGKDGKDDREKARDKEKDEDPMDEGLEDD